jgi:hypothetical protein
MGTRSVLWVLCAPGGHIFILWSTGIPFNGELAAM